MSSALSTNSRHAVHLDLAAELLTQFGQVQFVAQGTSMLPAIHPGDCLTIRSLGANLPARGEIVLSRRPGGFRIHRVARVVQHADGTLLYVLQGDSLSEPDPAIPLDEVLGRITSLVRSGTFCDVPLTLSLYRRVLRALIRNSRTASVLLLSWHAMRSRHFLRDRSRLAAPVAPKTECP